MSLEHSLYRETHTEAASSYIIRSEQTGSRTLVNYNDLPEMTIGEFQAVVRKFSPDDETWWHFEGRIPHTTLECVRTLRDKLPNAQISVEVEKSRSQGGTVFARSLPKPMSSSILSPGQRALVMGLPNRAS